jgi:hypothetical protein
VIVTSTTTITTTNTNTICLTPATTCPKTALGMATNFRAHAHKARACASRDCHQHYTTITSTNTNTVCLTPPTTGPKTTLGMAAHAKKALKEAVRPKRERTPIVSDLLAESADAKAMAKLLGRSQVSSKTIFSISVRLVRLGRFQQFYLLVTTRLSTVTIPAVC